MTAKSPSWSEQDRLAALHRLNILDTPVEQEFEDIVRVVAGVLEAPIAAINFIDQQRQWFKAEIGLGTREMPLDNSICKLAILEPGGMVVPDTTDDPRFDCNPLVTGEPGLRFYAGELLTSSDGLPLGTLCVLAVKPRQQGLTAQQSFVLKALARQVMTQLQLRSLLREQEKTLAERIALERVLTETRYQSDAAWKQAESQKRMLDAVLDAVPIGIGYADANGRIIDINAENKRLWGDHPLSSDIDEYVEWKGWWADGSSRHGKRLEPHEWGLARALLHGEEVTGDILEIEPFGMPGVRRTIMLRAKPIRDEGGHITGSVVAQMDITSQVKAEAASRENEAKFRRLVDSNIIAIVHYHLDGRLKEVNGAFLAMLGFTREDFENGLLSWRALTPPEWKEANDVALKELRATGLMQNFTKEYFRKDGSRATVVMGAASFEGNPDEGIAYMVDLSAHKKAECLLQESEAKFRTIANAMPQMVWSTLADGYHDYYNQQWYDYTGMPEGSTDGEKWNDLFHPEDQHRAWERWRQSLATGARYEIQYRLRHRSGEYRWVLGRALPICDDEGKIIRWMGTCTDIHEQKLLEHELKNVSQRKDEFLAMLAHELRNPLAPISTAAQLLRINSSNVDSVKRSSEVIARQVKHMTELVDDLLDVSRVTRGLVELANKPTSLKDVINNAIEQARPLIEAKCHTLSTTLPASDVCVLGDRTRLIQAIVNVLTNAAKYTPHQGRINLALTVEQTSAVVTVTDNGIGIEAKLLPRVFELFTQAERTPDRSQGGLGLGLALVRSIVELHRGKVRAQSEGPGHGSTFTLLLPVHVAVPAFLARTTADDEHHQESSLNILLVDDNADAADSLAALLQAYGHKLTICDNATCTLAEIDQHSPQVFILDIGLPDMDGYELCRRLRTQARFRDAIFIALTGYGQAHDKALARHAGFDYHFVKPVDIAQLQLAFAKVRPGETSEQP
jgi:hypothetical protein